MDDYSSRGPPVTPNQAALMAIAALATGVGLLPYLLQVDSVACPWAAMPVAAFAAYFALRGPPTRTPPTATPRIRR